MSTASKVAHELVADGSPKPLNSPRQVLLASLVGTAIEFFDFYIYATAAVLVFPALFFPAADPATATLTSLATFAIAFVARPVGSALFGHFGDRIGRKATLVAALMTMGVSTVADWAAAVLREHRDCRADPAGAVPVRSGPRTRRRVGRCRTPGDRECAAGKARLVRDVPAAGRPSGLLLLRRHLSGVVPLADRRAVLRLGLARALFVERRPGDSRAVHAAVDHRDAGFRDGDGTSRTGTAADVQRLLVARQVRWSSVS